MTLISATAKAMEEAALQADYAQAQPLFKVRLGSICLYFPQRLKTAYIPYASLSRVFLRVKTAVSRVC